jgi:hypothetical protein
MEVVDSIKCSSISRVCLSEEKHLKNRSKVNYYEGMRSLSVSSKFPDYRT